MRTTKVLVSTIAAVKTFSSVSWRTEVLLPWRRAPVKNSRSGGRQQEKLGCRQMTVWRMVTAIGDSRPQSLATGKVNEYAIKEEIQISTNFPLAFLFNYDKSFCTAVTYVVVACLVRSVCHHTIRPRILNSRCNSCDPSHDVSHNSTHPHSWTFHCRSVYQSPTINHKQHCYNRDKWQSEKA